MRCFLRQSIKGARCGSFNQNYKSSSFCNVFNNISKDLDVNGNICKTLDKNFEFTINHRKKIEDEYDSQVEDYRDIIQDEKAKYVNDKLSTLELHDNIKNLDLNNVMMDSDATSFYPSAMYNENSVYP